MSLIKGEVQIKSLARWACVEGTPVPEQWWGTEAVMLRQEAKQADKLSWVPEKLEFIHYLSDANLFQVLAYLWVKNMDDVFKDEEDVQRVCPRGSHMINK